MVLSTSLKNNFFIQFYKRDWSKYCNLGCGYNHLKKISFFKQDISVKYGNFFEFHKAYYITNEYILKKLPNYYISFLNQFIAITKSEYIFS